MLCCADDHSRVKLKAEINPSRTDYINASTIVSEAAPLFEPVFRFRSLQQRNTVLPLCINPLNTEGLFPGQELSLVLGYVTL